MPHDEEKADSPLKWLSYAAADLTMASIPLPSGARADGKIGFNHETCPAKKTRVIHNGPLGMYYRSGPQVL